MIPSLTKRWPFFFLVVFLLIFFRQVLFQGLLPIPADLLVSWFFPFSSGDYIGYSSWVTHKGLVADDAIRQQYPWKTFAVNQWKTGEIPLWNPYAFSGYPQTANLQTGTFYPFNFLFLFVDSKIAWTVLIILQPVLSFLFMYLFLCSLKITRWASVFGSLVFTGMTFELLWLEQMVIGQTTLWLPLILTAIQKFFEGKKKWWLVGIFGLTMSILAGYAQTTLYVFLVAGFFMLCKFIQYLGKPRVFLLGLFMLIFPIFLTAIQLLPTWESYQLSAREGLLSRELFSEFLATPRHLLTLFSSDFFGNVATENFWGEQYSDFNFFFGSIALLILTTGLPLMIKNHLVSKEVKWFMTLGLIALLLSLPPFGFIPLFLNIPILSTGVPARFIFIFQFSAAVLSAFALQFLTEKKFVIKFSLKPAIIIFLLVVGLTLGFFIAKISPDKAKAKNYLVTSRNLVLTSMVIGSGLIGFILLRKEKTKTLALIILLSLASLEYLYLANKYLPFSKREYLFPNHPLISFLKEKQGIDRSWGEGTAYMGTNIPTYYGLYYAEGYDSLYIRRYGELVYAANKGILDEKIPRSDVNIKQDAIFKEKLLDLLGVRYIFDKNDSPKADFEPEDWKFSPSRYKLIWQKGKFKVYENLKAFPRVYFAQQLIFKDNDKEIIKEVYQGNNQEKYAITEEPLGEDLTRGRAGQIFVEKYSPNKVIIKTKNDNSGFLVLSDNYFPGWRALIDNKETKIYRTNYNFRGIIVPAGDHKIAFNYEPNSFRYGMVISSFSLIIMSIFFILYGKNKILS